LPTFTAEAVQALNGPSWLAGRRQEAWAAFDARALPSEKEEVWRYSPIEELNLEAFGPVAAPASLGALGDAFVSALQEDLGPTSAVIVVHNGHPMRPSWSELPAGATVTTASELGDSSVLGSVLEGGDALVRLNDAFLADAVVVDVAPRTVVEKPIVIVHWSDQSGSAGLGPASFPRTVVRLGAGAQAGVVEVVAGDPLAPPSLVLPVTEVDVEDGAVLSYVSLQILGDRAWHIARLAGRVGRDAGLRAFGLGLGGAYDRARTDVRVTGQGGSSELRSVYLGAGSQVHDIRTQQDHAAPRTTSDLLCKGAVAGSSRSVYSGLIRVRHGAVRSDAMQTNHNLVLDPRAHADSVPNLDIEENDVRCSHASTVGPVDEEQLYYLESRGVPPERAERLIVMGFYEDIITRSPLPTTIARLRTEVAVRLAATLGITAAPPVGAHG
jgi:Fe-S cluster assembly protein SufD